MTRDPEPASERVEKRVHGMIPGSHERMGGPECRCGRPWPCSDLEPASPPPAGRCAKCDGERRIPVQGWAWREGDPTSYPCPECAAPSPSPDEERVLVDYNDIEHGEYVVVSRGGRSFSAGQSVMTEDGEGCRCPGVVVSVAERIVSIRLDMSQFDGSEQAPAPSSDEERTMHCPRCGCSYGPTDGVWECPECGWVRRSRLPESASPSPDEGWVSPIGSTHRESMERRAMARAAGRRAVDKHGEALERLADFESPSPVRVREDEERVSHILKPYEISVTFTCVATGVGEANDMVDSLLGAAGSLGLSMETGEVAQMSREDVVVGSPLDLLLRSCSCVPNAKFDAECPFHGVSGFSEDNSSHDVDCDCKACLIDTWHAEVDGLREALDEARAERDQALERLESARDWRDILARERDQARAEASRLREALEAERRDRLR